MPSQPGKPDYDAMAGEVDRLLRQLRPAEARPRRMTPTGGSPRPVMGTGPDSIPSAGYDPEPHDEPEGHYFELEIPAPLAVWGRVVLGLLLGAALTQWPYQFCGLSLAVYLLGAAMLLVTGLWACVGSWRSRMPIAHALAITIIIAGTAFSALQIVPRIGDGAVEASWLCLP